MVKEGDRRMRILKAKKYDVIVGIDPDKDKSGLVAVDRIGKKAIFETLEFPKLIDRVSELKMEAYDEGKTLGVYVEASWLISTNWHTLRNDSVALAASKGHSVGENHQTGRLIVQMLRYRAIDAMEQVPLKKCWKGSDGKITHAELERFVAANGMEMPKRTNQEQRDAALIALFNAGMNKYRL